MNGVTYAKLPQLPRTSFIATHPDYPGFYLVWFVPTGARGDWNVFRCDQTPAGELIRYVGQNLGWHAFCVQAETMFRVRGGADHALVAIPA